MIRPRVLWSLLSGIGLVLVAMCTTACAPSNIVQVAPQPRLDSLVFLVNDLSGATSAPATTAYGLSVLRCSDDRAYWTIAADGTRLMPMRVRYGSVIPGFRTVAGPDSLTPGCYRVVVSSASPVTFDVGADRRVTVRGR